MGEVEVARIANCQKLAYISDRRKIMERISEQIIQQAAALPEGTPLAAKGLLHLGSRAAVDQALSRLTERGCQSAHKTNPLSASKIDPSLCVEIRA